MAGFSPAFLLLARALLREWLRHPLQLLFALLGVALGVAVVVAIDLANVDARESFDRANRVVDGAASHRITSASGGLDEKLFARLKVTYGIRDAAPVIEVPVSAGQDDLTFSLMGIDPLFDYRLREFGLNQGDAPLQAFPLWLSAGLIDQLGLTSGDSITLQHSSRSQVFHIAGVLSIESGEQMLAVTDIAAAQVFLNKVGVLDHIDLALSSEQAAFLKDKLPNGVYLFPVGEYNAAKADMTTAFQTNLTALSLLALLVGMFLVYNSMSFQLLRRRRLFAMWRVLGTTQGEVFRLLMLESAMLGLVGTSIGLVFGVILSEGVHGLITGTIDALYFDFHDRSLDIEVITLAKGLMIGIAVTLTATVLPAWRAKNLSLIELERRSSQESRSFNGTAAVYLALAGSVMAIGLLLLNRSLVGAFTALFMIVIALASLIPFLLRRSVRSVQKFGFVRKHLGLAIGLGSIDAHLSRTAPATVALAVAMAATLGVALMIDSFRFSVDHWLQNYLRADVYMAAKADAQLLPDSPFVERLQQQASINGVSLGRRLTLASANGPVEIFLLQTTAEGFVGFQVKHSLNGDLYQRFTDQGEILISEAFANHQSLAPGDRLLLPTQGGERYFTIAAVYFDYSSDRGVVTLSANTWQTYFGDVSFNALSLYLADGAEVSVDGLIEHIQDTFSEAQDYVIRSNRSLRNVVLEVFDQTFLVTDVLRVLALIVAIVGIVSALWSVQLERAREFAIKRAGGFTRLDLVRHSLIETSVLGFMVGVFSLPIGLVLCVILIEVINTRAFGWTMHTVIDPVLLIQSVAVSTFAAVAAGAMASTRFRRFSIANNLKARFE